MNLKDLKTGESLVVAAIKDTEIFKIIQSEEARQKNGLEMIASENYCSS